MLQSIECVDAFLVVQAKKAFEKIETFRLQMLAKALVDVASLLFPFLLSLATRQRRPARHGSLGWRADELEDSNTLINVCATFKNWLSLEHFAEDASFDC
jgi:hypothetical protein